MTERNSTNHEEPSHNQPIVVDVQNVGLFYPIHRKRSIFKRIVSKQKSGEFWALRNVSFQCRLGDVVGVIGRNGAGKSTLSLLLSKIFEPDEGELIIDGTISALLSIGGMFRPNMTGRDNTYYFGAFLGFRRTQIDEMIDSIIDFSELGEFFDEPVGSYSSGMRSRLAFSIASSIQPDILVLDEVLSVGDRAFRQKCETRIHEMTKSCRAIIVISHSMGSIKKMCNKCLWLDSGKMVDYGDTEEIIDAYSESLAPK